MNDVEKLERARTRCIDSLAKNLHLYGVNQSVGRLYGLLYFNEEPMTLDCMKDELGMSKTSMSTSVRQLQELKMVEKVWKKGSRKDLYESTDDWYQTFADLFSVKWRKGIHSNIDQITQSLNEINELLNDSNTSIEVTKAATIDKEKLEYALGYYDWLNRFVDSIESKEIFKWIPKDNRHNDLS
ncbi:GbsR/MarR family transcriptional regulator [Bacillus sp. JCM 19034]|uniref:GbsR/MarR family transcriptional regulator n=1 Tax=Bacillus sp. JCM 19034 TaxID=1481928 RepID=UPI0007803469|nr:GbsR/MarR family transcriptional regulator [Bacillus sp. JCM 19034]